MALQADEFMRRFLLSMSLLAFCDRHHWTHHDHHLQAAPLLITGFYWPAVSALCPSLLATQLFDLCQTPLLPRALYHTL
jgi:hypothetical protein